MTADTVTACGGVTTLMKGLLGFGFWIQGIRVFPWVGVRYFLKDGLRVSPAVMQIVIYTADLPNVAKPIIGAVSDAVYIRGAHRLPYIRIGVVLQATAWTLMAILLRTSYMTVVKFFILLLMTVLGAAIVEVSNDAIVAEAGKRIQTPERLQSFVWMSYSCGGILGFLLAGVLPSYLPYEANFLLFVMLLIVQLLVTVLITEKSLGLSSNGSTASPSSKATIELREPRRQFIVSTNLLHTCVSPRPSKNSTSQLENVLVQIKLLTTALKRKEVLYSICWFAFSDSIVPDLSANMFYYHTKVLEIDSLVYGFARVFRQGLMLAWGVVYNRWLKNVSPRRVLPILQSMIILCMLSDIFFVKGFYRDIGVTNPVYVFTATGIVEALFFFKILTMNVLMARLCPKGCEGSTMALVMSAWSLSNICSAYFGIIVDLIIGISGHEDSRLVYALLTQAFFASLPLYQTHLISDGKEALD